MVYRNIYGFFTKCSLLDVWQGFEYTSTIDRFEFCKWYAEDVFIISILLTTLYSEGGSSKEFCTNWCFSIEVRFTYYNFLWYFSVVHLLCVCVLFFSFSFFNIIFFNQRIGRTLVTKAKTRKLKASIVYYSQNKQ